MKKASNAILGLAFNLDEKKLSPFLVSLDQSGFKGELILFVNNESFTPHNPRYNYTLTTVNLEKKYRSRIILQKMIRKTQKIKLGFLYRLWNKRTILKARNLLEQSRPFPLLLTSYFYTAAHLTTSRFIFYYNYLLLNKYKNVFFCDVTDVIIQDDPFRNVEKGRLHAFLEDESLTIGTQEHNKDWIMQGFGEGVFGQMHDERVYCAGTILADHTTSIRFLKDFIRENCKDNIPSKLAGMDQGVYNYMISMKKLSYFKINVNGKIVFTVGAVSPEDIRIAENKIYSRQDLNSLPSVIHQYNRHPLLTDLVERIYGLGR